MKHDLSHTMLVDDSPNDLDQTNLHDVTINNVNSIDLLKDGSDM